jgi:hypothetical protein
MTRTCLFVQYIFISDIDECLSSPCTDHAVCRNTIGSFTCQCVTGFTAVNGQCQGKCNRRDTDVNYMKGIHIFLLLCLNSGILLWCILFCDIKSKL